MSAGQISAEHYKRAIAEAFPQLAIEHIELDSSGWDSVVAVVNDKIIFRFPRRAEVACRLEVESRLLPELRKVVSLPIPNFEFVSQSCEAFPNIFVGYRMIPGEPLTKALFEHAYSIELAQRLARQLAKFLSELHSFPVERAVEFGVPHTPDRDLLVHGDFSPDHILFDRKTGCTSGIIDFGDVRIGDPAYDLQLKEDYGEVFWEALLAHYKLKIDEAFFRRLEFYAKRLPLGEILYGLTHNVPEHIASGLQTLRRRNRVIASNSE